MSRSVNPHVITLLAVVAAAMPIESLVLSHSLLVKGYCFILAIMIGQQWRSSRRLMREIEGIRGADTHRGTDPAKVRTSAIRVAANNFVLILLSWIVGFSRSYITAGEEMVCVLASNDQ